MGKYFGTDGFRGEANVDLKVTHAYKVGRYLGYYYGKDHKANCSSHLMGFKVCIDMLSLNGADVSYPGYFKETDIGEMIYQLVSNGNIATLYFNLDKNDKQCQVYLPENPTKEQLKTFKENYVNTNKKLYLWRRIYKLIVQIMLTMSQNNCKIQ